MRPARVRVSPAAARASRPFIGAVFLAAVACGGKSAPNSRAAQEETATPSEQARRFAAARDAFYQRYLELSPTFASSLGYHRFDGALPDVSIRGLTAHGAWLRTQQASFEAVPAAALEAEARVEREVILAVIRGDRFDLEVARWPFTNPMSYVGRLALTGYVARDYAPLADRARAVIALSGQAKAYLETAQANLAETLPRPSIDAALAQVDVMVDLARNDMAEAFARLNDPALRTEVADGLRAYAAAMTGYSDFLRRRQRKATPEFALGPDRFRRMLVAKEGVSIDLERLRLVGAQDLARNLAVLELSAREIDRKKPVPAVVDLVKRDKPDANNLLGEATAQVAAMRKLVIDQGIATIPGEDVAEVRPAPPFLRWGFAFLSSPGPFEGQKLPAYYYVSAPATASPPGDPGIEIPSRGEFLYTTVQEVWPGRFLHYLYRKQTRSRVLRSFCFRSAVEGWAHYAEQVMHEAGASGADPKLAVGQLVEALVSDMRYLSSIGLHISGLTVRETASMFESQAFADRELAREEATRGTFDPGYLGPTLGKLMIRKLREDWKVKAGNSYSLKAFHDRFLSYGCAPVPVIRRAMLGPDAGPEL